MGKNKKIKECEDTSGGEEQNETPIYLFTPSIMYLFDIQPNRGLIHSGMNVYSNSAMSQTRDNWCTPLECLSKRRHKLYRIN